MDDDDDVFAALVDAMGEELEEMESSQLETEEGEANKPIHQTPYAPTQRSANGDISKDYGRTSMDPDSMLKRIQQLEAELAQQKQALQGSASPKALPRTSSVPGPSQGQPAAPATKKARFLKVDTDISEIIDKKPSQAHPKKSSTLRKPLTLADIGLSESSDEDEDTPSLSKAGKALKRKLALQEVDERDAKRKTAIEASISQLDTKSPFTSFASPVASSQVQLKGPKPAEKVVEKCPYSGIALLNPILSTSDIQDRLGSKRFCKLSQLPSLKSSIHHEMDWMTVGVVVQKLPTKMSANGTPFSIWKLNDLEETSKMTTLFLFSDAHKDCWRIPVRTVVAVLAPTIMPNKQGKDDLSISVTAGNRVIELGFAEDMGICKGHTKGGEACTNLINSRKAEFCVYHLKAALQKVSSSRMELQANYSGVQPKGSKVQQVADGYIYGGKMFANPGKMAPPTAVTKSATKAPVAAKYVSKEAQALIDEARAVAKRNLTEEESNMLDKMTKNNAQLNKVIINDGPGTRNLLRSATKKEMTGPSAKARFVTPGQMLEEHKAKMAKLMAANQSSKIPEISTSLQNSAQKYSSQSPSSLLSPQRSQSTHSEAGHSSFRFNGSLNVAPKLARNSLVGDVISLDEEEATQLAPVRPKLMPLVSTPSQSRALAKLKESGLGIAKGDPNKLSNGLSARARDHIQEHLHKADKPLSSPAQRRVCNLAEDPEIQALLKETSLHEDLCKVGEMNYIDNYFAKATVKESIEEAMENTMEMECSVVTCKKCGYTANSLADRCFNEKHDHVRHKATKKFFQCKKCSKRKPSFNVIPSPCKSCGGSYFQRCGMLAYERKGPKLDSEMLLIRGDEEPKFLNSLRN
ncbi:hypothetical protein RvY_14556 [Ramazzottius varieornatus]|uniref:Protein MCM10 homolog n=1 Tax=Ramazzottius varieornatus TaxID=947166 RepID=A0A1D1VTN1_RAMVA|nr:hypothetical protein RvY_14556 [Ramazzottius varieornatus]